MPIRRCHRSTPSLVPILALAGSPLAMVGCTGALNQSTGVLGADLPDLAPIESIPEADHLAADADRRWMPRRVDRRTWATVVVSAPRGQVEVNPTPVFEVRPMPGRDAPGRNLPTPEQAVSAETDDGRVAVAAALDPLRSAWSLVESPVGLVVRPPWQLVRDPSGPAEMLPPRGDAPTGIREVSMRSSEDGGVS